MSPSQERTFIDSVIAEWDLLACPASSTIRRAPELGKAVIEVESVSCLGLMEVWEDGRCLDITVHHQGKKQGSILAGGFCGGQEEMGIRLRMLCDEFKKEEECG